MRRTLVVIASFAAVLGSTTPVTALSRPTHAVGFTMSPVGGTSGTRISIEGFCYGASEGDAYLERPTYSDALLPPVDQRHFVVSEDAGFTADLVSPYSAENGFPVDARVRVVCGISSAVKPFHGSSTVPGGAASVFTSLGEVCGRGFAPPGNDARIPCPAHVKGFEASGRLAEANFYPSDGAGGASVAMGDVDRDGTVDVLTGSGPGDPTTIRLFSDSGELKWSFLTYYQEDSEGNRLQFRGGVNVAIGDVTGDGQNEIVTGAGPGGGPHVLVFSNTNGGMDMIGSFYAYEPGFSGGVNVAVVNREIVTAPGPGGGPHIRRFGATGVMAGEFMAYEPRFTGGVSVAGWSAPFDGRIVTAPGPGGGPHVRVFQTDGVPLNGFYAYEPGFTGGVSVAVGRAGNAGSQIVTGPGPGGGPHVAIFNIDGSPKGGFYAHQNFTAGLRVAAAP